MPTATHYLWWSRLLTSASHVPAPSLACGVKCSKRRCCSGEVLWKTVQTTGTVCEVSFRPTAADTIRRAWTRRHTHRRSAQRALTVTCLALGAFGGISAGAAACSPDTAVHTDRLAATVNRAVVVDGFADAFINAYLSGAAGPTPLPLTEFTSVPIDPPPVPLTVIKTGAWSTQPADSGYANIDYWSVVIGAFVKPLGKAPQLWFYQVPVAVVDGAPRIPAAPAFLNGPPPGYDPELAYPAAVATNSDAHQAIAGFLDSWLAGAGDISRYSTAETIAAFTDTPFTRITVSEIKAATEIPAAPADGFKTQILATVIGHDGDRIAQTLTYPLTVSYRTNKWFITDIDLAPRLGARLNESTAPMPHQKTSPPTKKSPRG